MQCQFVSKFIVDSKCPRHAMNSVIVKVKKVELFIEQSMGDVVKKNRRYAYACMYDYTQG